MPTRDRRRSRGDTSSDETDSTGRAGSSGSSSSSSSSSYTPPPSPSRRDSSTAGSSGGSSGGSSSPDRTETVRAEFTPPPSPERRDSSTVGSSPDSSESRVDASEVSVGDFQQFEARNPVTRDASRTSVGDMQAIEANTVTDSDIERSARTQAAESDPLRDPGDFVADVDIDSDGSRSVDVRRRNRPFFERQRQALGFDTPEESRIRGGLRSRSQ